MFPLEDSKCLTRLTPTEEFLVQTVELVALTEEWPALMVALTEELVALTEEFLVQNEEWLALMVALAEELVGWH